MNEWQVNNCHAETGSTRATLPTLSFRLALPLYSLLWNYVTNYVDREKTAHKLNNKSFDNKEKKTHTKKSYRFFLVAIMIDNLTKSATFLITLVVDIFKEAKEIECLFFVQDDLVTWNQSTFMIELLQTLFSHY